MNLRPTVRLRFTALFGGLFLLAGFLLLAINYVFVRNSLPSDRLAIRTRAPEPFEAGIAHEFATPGDIVAARPFTVEGEPVTISELQERIDARLRRTLLLQSGQTLALMGIVSIGLGWIAAGRILRPVHQITEAARRISGENLHERIALEGPDDELRELASTFDDLLGRLEEAFDSQRRFVANASHELRTPLTIMRAEVDVALASPDTSPDELRAMAQSVRDAVDRSEALVDGLLVLARSDRGLADGAADVRFDETLAAASAQLHAAAAAEGIDVNFEVAPVSVRGDRTLLERLCFNLLENAVRYNRAEDGRVDVALFEHAGTAVLRVANTGQRIDGDAVDGLFEPFRRLERDRTSSARGAGLGLSIVRSVARVHGGTVTARARPEGGLEVEVRIPVDGSPLT